MIHRVLTRLVGITALVLGLLGVDPSKPGRANEGRIRDPNILGLANLERPADNVLHLFVAA